MAEKKVCFAIAPIGITDSATRHRSERVYEDIVKPAARRCRYLPIHSQEVARPGIISTEAIRHVLNDPLVIADLSGGNASVFYTLALRHAVRKPVVQLLGKDEKIPFNMKDLKIILFDIDDVASRASAIVEIVRQIKEMERDASSLATPFSITGAATWSPFTQHAVPRGTAVSSLVKNTEDVMAALKALTPAEAIPAMWNYIEDLKKNSSVYVLETPIDDLDAACTIVNRVPEGGFISGTSSLQSDDADERMIYRTAVNLALERNVTYCKVICSAPELAIDRREKWLEEFRDKADLIRNSRIRPTAFKLLHYPSPMSVDVLISQDADRECQEMVAGFAAGGGHGGFYARDKGIVENWLDVYLERKIIVDATSHTKKVLDGIQECDCWEFMKLLEDARQAAGGEAAQMKTKRKTARKELARHSRQSKE